MGIKDKIADMTGKNDDAAVDQPHDEGDPNVQDGVKDPLDIPSPNVILRNMDASGKQQPNQAD